MYSGYWISSDAYNDAVKDYIELIEEHADRHRKEKAECLVEAAERKWWQIWKPDKEFYYSIAKQHANEIEQIESDTLLIESLK